MTWRPKRRVMPNGTIVWVARYKDERGNVRLARPAWNGSSGTFALKRDAQRAIDEAYVQRTPERADTIGGYLDRWLQTRPRAERTDRTNKTRIKAVLDVELEGLPLAEWDMRDLRRRHAYELVGHMLMNQERSPGGARNILRALSAMAEDAISDELCEVNPWTGVKVRDDDRRATKRRRELRVWSFEDMHTFAAAAGRDEAMVRTLADCGLRVGELFALSRSHFASNDTLLVRGSAWEGSVVGTSGVKNHNRDVPIPPGCQELLRAMPVQLHSPWLFPTQSGGLWRYSNFKRQVWVPTIKRAGIDPTPHEFRHSWVTHLRAAGVDPADLADVAGHSVDTATNRYTHPLRRSYDEIRGVVG